MKRRTTSPSRDRNRAPARQAASPPATETEDRFAALDPADLNDSERGSIIRLALRVLAERHRPGRVLGSPEDTRAYLRLGLAGYKNEVFGCVFLDNRHRILGLEHLFQGTVDGASVHPRVVVQQALELNAAAVVLYHNHPSGVAEPSRSDELLTRRLREALALVDVRVLDHFGKSEAPWTAQRTTARWYPCSVRGAPARIPDARSG